jgi:SAM-dependent methyltransferase
MSLLSQVRLFVQRRIALPIPDDALVLDVGSGDKPSWRADVLLDRYVDASHAGQRSGTGAARISRPLFDGDAADMPFADGAFDYTICSNVLEHVPDPGAVIEELMRVSRAGYIEVPEAASAKIVDFPSHVWWIRLDDSTDPPTLCFEPKQSRWSDPEIGRYFERTGLDTAVAKVLDSQFEDRVIMLHWQDRIAYRVEGSVAPDFMSAALSQPGHTKDLRAKVIAAATDVITWRRRAPLRSRTIPFDSVVRPDLRRGDGSVLERRVYTDEELRSRRQ